MKKRLRNIIFAGLLFWGGLLSAQESHYEPHIVNLNNSVYYIETYSLNGGIALKFETRNSIINSNDYSDIKILKLNSKLKIDFETRINSGVKDESYSNLIDWKNDGLALIVNERDLSSTKQESLSKIYRINKFGKTVSKSEFLFVHRSLILKLKNQAVILGTQQKHMPALDRSIRNKRYDLFFSRGLEDNRTTSKVPHYFSFHESTRQIVSASSYDNILVAVLHKASPGLENYGNCIRRFDESFVVAFDISGETLWQFELPNDSVNTISYIKRIIKQDDRFELLVSTEQKVPFNKSRKAWCVPNRHKTIREKIQDNERDMVSDFDKASKPPNNGSDTTAFVVDYYPPTYKTISISFNGERIEASQQLYDAKEYGTFLKHEILNDKSLILLSRKEKSVYVHKYLDGKRLWLAEFESILPRPNSDMVSLAHLPDDTIILSVLEDFKTLNLISIGSDGKCEYQSANLIHYNSR